MAIVSQRLPINTCDCFMPLSNVNMPCLLVSRLILIVLFHCRALSPADLALDSSFVPPPTHVETSPSGLTGASRDEISLIVTQRLGLPPLYSHPTIPLSVHYALNLFFRAQKSAHFTLFRMR